MNARTSFVLAIVALAIGAVLWCARGGEPVAQSGERVPSAGDAPATVDARPAPAAAGDAQRTLAAPASDASAADAALQVEVVFAGSAQPAGDAAVFVTPTKNADAADDPGQAPSGRTGPDGVLRVPRPTENVFVTARRGSLYAQKAVAMRSTNVRLELGDDDAIAVRVVDSAARSLAGVVVRLGAARSQLSCPTNADGIAVLPHVQRYGGRDAMRLLVAIPGRFVDVPVPLVEGPQPFVLSLGDVGTLAVAAPGCTHVRAQVRAADLSGPIATLDFPQGRGDVLVAAACRFRVSAWAATVEDTRADVVGPVANGDRVEVELQLGRARIRGRFAPPPGEHVRCVVIGTENLFGVDVFVDPDGAFEVFAPRWPAPALLAFVTQRLCCECPQVRLERGDCDLGALELSPRPVVGILDVTMPTGRGGASFVAIRQSWLRGGQQAPSARFGSDALAVPCNRPDHGVEVLALPCIASVTAAAHCDGLFCEPETVVLQGGDRRSIVLAVGGSAVVRLAAPDLRGIVPVRLRPTAGGAVVASRSASLETGGQRSDFADVRPGEYTVEVEGGEVDGAPFRVIASDCAVVRATLRPR